MGFILALFAIASPWATLKAAAGTISNNGNTAPESTVPRSTVHKIAQTSSPTTPLPSATPATPPQTPPAAPQEKPPTGSQSAPIAPRVDNTSLYEKTDYIGMCRRTNTTVGVFSDTALSPANRLGTLTPNTSVELTGVLAPGLAQITRRTSPTTIVVVGWVSASHLTTCGTPALKACYQVNVDYLSVRTAPSTGSNVRGSLRINSIVYATSNPPKEQTSGEGRIWSEINYLSSPGWISRTGPNGVGNNATRLPDTQCGG